mgnify:CR=1 FL=1
MDRIAAVPSGPRVHFADVTFTMVDSDADAAVAVAKKSSTTSRAAPVTRTSKWSVC